MSVIDGPRCAIGDSAPCPFQVRLSSDSDRSGRPGGTASAHRATHRGISCGEALSDRAASDCWAAVRALG